MHVIRRHFLAATVDPAVSLSTYSTLPMEVVRPRRGESTMVVDDGEA